MKNIAATFALAALLLYAWTGAAASSTRKETFAADNKPVETHSDSLRYRYSDNPRIDAVVSNTKLFVNNPNGGHVNEDSARMLIATFYANQFRHFQDPQAPYFMFMSRDSKMALGIGGLLKLKAWFDWDGAVEHQDFAPYFITIPRDPANDHALKATPSGSAFFFTLLGQNTSLGNYMGYIQANFDGYDHINCKLDKAYFTVNNWTVGLANSTFSDPAAEPPMVDGGTSGKMSRSNMLVRYVQTMGKEKHWTVAASLEFPSSNIDADNVLTKKSNDWLPDMVAMGQYAWDHGLSHVRLAGLVRSLSYRDMVLGKNHTLPGWGVHLSGVFSTPSPVTLYVMSSIGQGHGTYNGDLSKGSFDLIDNPQEPGKMYAPFAWSGVLGFKYQWSPSVFSTLCVSELRYLPRHEVGPETYKYGLYGGANVFWSLTPRVMLGGEYLISKRMNHNGMHGIAQRVDAVFQVSF